MLLNVRVTNGDNVEHNTNPILASVGIQMNS